MVVGGMRDLDELGHSRIMIGWLGEGGEEEGGEEEGGEEEGGKKEGGEAKRRRRVRRDGLTLAIVTLWLSGRR